MGEITKIKVNGDPESSYQLYPRNEEFAKRAGGNTGSQNGGSGSIPKPLTYDYMPEGYPTKSVQTTTLMEEHELAFSLSSANSAYGGVLTPGFKLVEGQTYAVNWDGTEYECICVAINSIPCIGNLSNVSMGDDTGEPFVYVYNSDKGFGVFSTPDTAASHTISVKTPAEVITPIAEEFLPATALITFDSNAGTLSSDLTYDELYARLLDGKQVVLRDVSRNEYLYLTKWNKQSSGRIDLFFNGDKRDSISLYTDGVIAPTPVA